MFGKGTAETDEKELCWQHWMIINILDYMTLLACHID